MKRLGGHVVMLLIGLYIAKGDWEEGKRSRRASATVGFPRWQNFSPNKLYSDKLLLLWIRKSSGNGNTLRSGSM
eukprot:scaffold1022_cov196-Alexandrium_tamarense.AAC.29